MCLTYSIHYQLHSSTSAVVSLALLLQPFCVMMKTPAYIISQQSLLLKKQLQQQTFDHFCLFAICYKSGSNKLKCNILKYGVVQKYRQFHECTKSTHDRGKGLWPLYAYKTLICSTWLVLISLFSMTRIASFIVLMLVTHMYRICKHV